jgi:hypothetical protein
MILMSFSFCFADGLELLDSYPKDGSHDARPENFLVKLYFNEDVSSQADQANNEGEFKFTDAKGKALPIKVLYDEKKPKEIWVLVEKTLESDSEYKLHISGNLATANGNTLDGDKTINLKTRNTSTDNNVNMALMGVMMVGMIVFTSLSAKRQVKKQEEEERSKSDSKVNPYKVAKETGKAVEDIVAKTEKEKEKAKAQAEKKNKGKPQDAKKTEQSQDEEKDTKRVTGARPIAAAGSTYITGRKEEAEKERDRAATKAAAGTTRPKSATGKDKNKKAKSKK